VACRKLKVSRAGFYEWRERAPSARQVADQALTETICRIHRDSGGSYGAKRMHDELSIEHGVRCGRKRVARLLREAGLRGVSHVRKNRSWRPAPAPHDDLVRRQFRADEPDRVWFADITQHRASDGWVYCCAVLDTFSRRIVGWSIADRATSDLVTVVLEMARWTRRPQPGTIVHADRGAQYTSWVFGHRLRQAGLLGSMGKVASNVDNAMMESFWSTMQRELLDRHAWTSRTELASAIFEWIEGFYNPRRRHTGLTDHRGRSLSPATYEALHNHAHLAA